MNWMQQAENITKNWSDLQQKMWKSWFETVQELTKSPSDSDQVKLWRDSLAAWEDFVKTNLEAQTEWTEMWADSLTDLEGVPKEIVEYIELTKESSEHWNRTQEELWEAWFDIMKQADPIKMSAGWGSKTGLEIIKTWQNTSRQILEFHAEWTRFWVP